MIKPNSLNRTWVVVLLSIKIRLKWEVVHLFVLWFLTIRNSLKMKATVVRVRVDGTLRVVDQLTVADPGFPMRGGGQPRSLGAKTYYLARFLPKTAWKWKKFDRGNASLVPPLDPPMIKHFAWVLLLKIKNTHRQWFSACCIFLYFWVFAFHSIACNFSVHFMFLCYIYNRPGPSE